MVELYTGSNHSKYAALLGRAPVDVSAGSAVNFCRFASGTKRPGGTGREGPCSRKAILSFDDCLNLFMTHSGLLWLLLLLWFGLLRLLCRLQLQVLLQNRVRTLQSSDPLLRLRKLTPQIAGLRTRAKTLRSQLVTPHQKITVRRAPKRRTRSKSGHLTETRKAFKSPLTEQSQHPSHAAAVTGAVLDQLNEEVGPC